MKKQILIIGLIVIIMLGQLLPISLIAADYTELPQTTSYGYEETYETIEDYLKVYYEYVDKSEITEIEIYGYNITIKDFGGLSEFTNLERLELNDVSCSDDILNNLTNLKYLKITGDYFNKKDISNLGIEKLVKLEELYLNNVICKDNTLTNLSKLTHLTLENIYDIDGEKQKDISKLGIEKLVKLKELSLTNVMCNDNILISNLTDLTHLNLKTIYESSSSFKDISNFGIEKLQNLRDLTLSHIRCNDIMLNNLSNLTNLTLDSIYDKDLETIDITKLGIEKLVKLEELNVVYAICADNILSNLSNLTNLTLDSIYDKDLETIDMTKLGIEKLVKLKNLNLQDVICRDNALSNLSNLTHLYISNIYDINGETKKDISKLGIDKLEKLEILYLDDVICKDNALSNLSNLINLDIYQIYDIDGETKKDISKLGIEKLENLIYFNVYHLTNSISLKNNKKLECCTISIEGDFSNKTIDVRGLENLKEFYLSFSTSEVSGFEADKCILIDEELDVYTMDDYISYFYYSYDIDLELPASYITDKVTEDIRGEEKILHGFELTNNKLTIKDLNEGNYIQEGIEYKIYDVSGNEITDTSKGLGTGSKIAIYQDEELVEEYTVVIYGDTSGDGQITPVDALTLIKELNKKIEYVSPMCEEAGKILTKAEEKKPSAVDALAIIKHLNNKYEIQQGM